jgi:hypothetical protein
MKINDRYECVRLLPTRIYLEQRIVECRQGVFAHVRKTSPIVRARSNRVRVNPCIIVITSMNVPTGIDHSLC